MVAIAGILRFKSKASSEAIKYWTSRSAENAFIGRTADAKEKATYCITSQNVSLITDAIVAFAIASQNHRDDFKRIFEKIEALR